MPHFLVASYGNTEIVSEELLEILVVEPSNHDGLHADANGFPEGCAGNKGASEENLALAGIIEKVSRKLLLRRFDNDIKLAPDLTADAENTLNEGCSGFDHNTLITEYFYHRALYVCIYLDRYRRLPQDGLTGYLVVSSRRFLQQVT